MDFFSWNFKLTFSLWSMIWLLRHYFNYSCNNETYDEIFSYRFSSKVVNPTVQVCSCSKLGRHIAYRWPDYATTGLKRLLASVISFPIIVVPIIKVWLTNITWISIWNKLSKICILIMVDCVPITYKGCLM